MNPKSEVLFEILKRINKYDGIILDSHLLRPEPCINLIWHGQSNRIILKGTNIVIQHNHATWTKDYKEEYKISICKDGYVEEVLNEIERLKFQRCYD